MSKKLLMCAKDDEYRGPVVYETLAGIDIQAKPTDENYKLLGDEPLYFNGFNGTIQFNGSSLPTFLGEEVEPGIYEYSILQQSVEDPSKQSIIKFRLNKQLVSWRTNWYDRMYWDDSEGCYMIEKNASFVRLDGSDSSNVVEASGVFASVSVGGYPNSCDEYIAPYVTSNWSVSTRNNAVNSGLTSIIGYAWTASNLSFYLPDKNISGASDLMNIFTVNPVNATFPAHNTVASGSLSDSNVSPAEGIVLERTSLTKKIKLKQYSGGTIYSMINSTGSLKGTILIDIPTMENKYMPFNKTFEGTDVVLDIDDNHMVDPNGKVYLEWFECTENTTADYGNPFNLMAEVLPNHNYRYEVIATSADGLQSKSTFFEMDYIPVKNRLSNNTSFKPSIEWNTERECYVLKSNAMHFRLDSLNHPKYGAPTGNTNINNYFGDTSVKVYYYDNIPYMGWPSSTSLTADNGVNADVPSGLYINTGTYYLGYYQGTNWTLRLEQYPNGFGFAVVKSGSGQSAVWCSTDSEFEDALAKLPIDFIYNYKDYYDSGYLTQNTMLNKKVELPNFGPGTKYSLQYTNPGPDKTVVKANIRISADIKYNFKLEYKILDGRDIYVKSTNCMIVRHDKPAYIIQVRGESQLGYNTSTNTETIQLLGNRISDGSYEYYLKQNINDKETIINTFKIPYMLTFSTINGLGVKPESSYESPPQQSILYWDLVSKSYKVEQRSMYYFADSAYGIIDFVPYTYSNYNIKEGAWEFLVEGKPNYNFSASQSPDGWSNYITRSFQYAYNTDHEIGTVFPILNGSSFPSANYNVMGIYTTANSYDALDTYLRYNPLHLIIMPFWRYSNGWRDVPKSDTGIKKPIVFEITELASNKGATYSISNDDLSARFKMALPVTYLDVDLPTPDYTLASPLDCNGSNVYVNTGLQLFDSAKDFTILLDYQHYCSEGTYVADDRVILHCRYENTGTSYKRCGLAVETGTAPKAHVRGATDYRSNGDILDTSDYALELQSKDMDTPLSKSNYRYRIVIVYKAGLPHRVIQVNENNILYDYPLYSSVPQFRSHTRPLYLGCQNSTSNSRSKYFAGRINECKVWNGTALNDDQILRAIGDGPYPEPNYSISDCVCSSSNRVNTGMKIFDIYKDSTIAIKFTSKTSSIDNLGHVLNVGCGDDDSFALRILYNNDENSYRVQHSGNKLANYTNILDNDATLPADANGDICIFIVYKMGKPSAIVDYSTGEAVYLPLNDMNNFDNCFNYVKYAVTLGYRQQKTNDSTKTTDVWDGTIHNCMIWNGRALNESQIDNVYKRLLK